MKETAACEVAFTRRSDKSASKRLKRLLDLIMEHDAHGWPSDEALHKEIRAIFPTAMRCA